MLKHNLFQKDLIPFEDPQTKRSLVLRSEAQLRADHGDRGPGASEFRGLRGMGGWVDGWRSGWLPLRFQPM